ncbi:hypothetical protein NM208_g6397 [Fusarium decemcellulare]|uniref:Uncharacterized protein n=1 Tax=Fusarium decemcellulare TaxID=57161 RepID=A0ACC1SD40_9HYPO|nr:hypothetical protein NM208_g6397 [Fusarium decemcellulare]
MQQKQQQGRRPRRSHAKSRNGYANCKRRKVKVKHARILRSLGLCRTKITTIPTAKTVMRSILSVGTARDTSLPVASQRLRLILLFAPRRVTLRGSCQISMLPQTSPLMAIKRHRRPPNHPLNPTPLTHLDPLPPGELTRRGLELMHHYCTVTANTLSLRRDMAYAWQVAVAREGYNHSYVSDGVLALAAAHKAYLVPNNCEVYLKLCDYHSIVGSEAFRHDLQNSTKSIKQKLDDPTARLLELASLARGMRTSLSPLVARIFVSEFAPLAYGVWPAKIDGGLTGHPSLDGTFLPNDFWDATARLRAFQQIELPLHSRAHYQNAVDKLEHAARIISVAGASPEIGAIVTWLQDVDDCIFVDMAAYKPPALVLLAYFCVFLAGMKKNFWYVRGWDEQLFDRVEVLLESRAAPQLDALKPDTSAEPKKLSGLALYSRFAFAGAVCCSVTHGGLTPVDV